MKSSMTLTSKLKEIMNKLIIFYSEFKITKKRKAKKKINKIGNI